MFGWATEFEMYCLFRQHFDLWTKFSGAPWKFGSCYKISQGKGIKLNAKKCHFFKREVKCLGRLISKDGYRADPQDSIALKNFHPRRKTVGELRSVLGFLSYYHCYVKHFSKISEPLYDLLKKDITKPKVKKSLKSLKWKKQINWIQKQRLNRPSNISLF